MPAAAPHQAIRKRSAFLQLPATGGINKQTVSKQMGTEHCLRSGGAVLLAREAGGLRVQPEGSGKEPGRPGGPCPLQLPRRPRPTLPAVPAAGQVRLLPLLRAAPVAAAAHPLLHAGLGEEPQRSPLPLELPGEGPQWGGDGRLATRSPGPAGYGHSE